MPTKFPKGPNDIDPLAQYIVVTTEGFSYQEPWYGPPDPQPSGYTTAYHPQIQTFKNEEELLEWICKNDESVYNKLPYKAFKIAPVEVSKTVSISLKGA